MVARRRSSSRASLAEARDSLQEVPRRRSSSRASLEEARDSLQEVPRRRSSSLASLEEARDSLQEVPRRRSSSRASLEEASGSPREPSAPWQEEPRRRTYRRASLQEERRPPRAHPARPHRRLARRAAATSVTRWDDWGAGAGAGPDGERRRRLRLRSPRMRTAETEGPREKRTGFVEGEVLRRLRPTKPGQLGEQLLLREGSGAKNGRGELLHGGDPERRANLHREISQRRLLLCSGTGQLPCELERQRKIGSSPCRRPGVVRFGDGPRDRDTDALPSSAVVAILSRPELHVGVVADLHACLELSSDRDAEEHVAGFVMGHGASSPSLSRLHADPLQRLEHLDLPALLRHEGEFDDLIEDGP